MIVLESSIITAIMNTTVIITTVVIAVVVSFVLHFDFIYFFFFYQNGPLLGILNAQNIYQLPIIEMQSIFDLIGFQKARKDKMQC